MGEAEISQLEAALLRSGLPEEDVRSGLLAISDEAAQTNYLNRCFKGEIKINITPAYLNLSEANQKRVDEMFVKGKLDGQFNPHFYFWPRAIKNIYFPQLVADKTYSGGNTPQEAIFAHPRRFGDYVGIQIASLFGRFTSPRQGQIHVDHFATTKDDVPGPTFTVCQLQHGMPLQTFEIILRQDSSSATVQGYRLETKNCLSGYKLNQEVGAHKVLSDMRRYSKIDTTTL